VPSLIEIGLLVPKKKFKKKNSVDFYSCYYLPWGKGVHHLYNFESPLPKDDLFQVWLKLAKRFWRRRKCNRSTDGQRAIRKVHR
jgi:hypothetical protein